MVVIAKYKKIVSVVIALLLIVGFMLPGSVEASLLHNKEPGTIITFSGKEWMIIDQLPDGRTYVILKDSDGKRKFDTDISNPYNDTPSVFNNLRSKNIGYYLNNTFYNGLSQKELIGAFKSLSEIKEDIGADSLGFLSIDGILKSLGIGNKFCLGCFNGKHPRQN